MLSRLTITLAQLRAGNNSEETWKWNKTTIVFFVCSKKWLKQSVNIWLTIFNNRSNL